MLKGSVNRFARMLAIGATVAALCIGVSSANDDAPVAAQAKAEKSLRVTVKDLAKRIEKKPERIWVYSYEIGALAAKDTSKLAELASEVSALLESENEEVRLTAAALTLSLGADGDSMLEDAADVLTEIISEGKNANVASAARTLKALDLEEVDDALDSLKGALEERDDLDGEAKVALSEAEYYYAEDKLVLERLQEWTSSEDETTARWASFALARNGRYAQVAAKIREISEGAGEMATLAQIIIENEETKSELESAKSPKVGNDIVEECIDAILNSYDGKDYFYADEKLKLNVSSLLDNAYRGMASSLDRYSAMMTSKEFKKQQESNANSYAGIGAYVGKSDDDPAIRISSPIYSGPAYKAGLRSGDLLWKCQLDDGEAVSLVGMTVAEGIKILRGPVDTRVKLWVKRDGEKDLIKLEFTRAQVSTNPSPVTMLPGKIGYLKLKHFGDNNTSRAFLAGMKELVLDSQANGVILDLRNNPGGSLGTVLVIAGLLLEKEAKITNLSGIYPPYNKGGMLLRSRIPTPIFKDVPMVCLINGSSASGSELLSGTLQDHKRMKIIGEDSFGKGIGQSFYPITESQTFDRRGDPTQGGLTREVEKPNGRILKTTIFSYFLQPSGRSIDLYSKTPSVRPDIVVHNPLLTSWEVKYAAELAESRKLDVWVRERFKSDRETYLKLAEYDGYTTASYKGFDELYVSLNTPLSKDRVRKMLRGVIRGFAADEKGAEFIQDYQLDKQLQRGIIEVAAEANAANERDRTNGKAVPAERDVDLGKIVEYAPFAPK